MIKKEDRTVWIADDGTEFDTYEEAFWYDLIKDVEEWLNRSISLFCPDSDLVHSIAKEMVDSRSHLADILKREPEQRRNSSEFAETFL